MTNTPLSLNNFLHQLLETFPKPSPVGYPLCAPVQTSVTVPVAFYSVYFFMYLLYTLLGHL